MNSSTLFYICPICYQISDTQLRQHPHAMIFIDMSKFGDEDRKPLMDASGRLCTAMPRWFVEARIALYRQ